MNSSAINRSGEFGQIIENSSPCVSVVLPSTARKRIKSDLHWTSRLIHDKCDRISKDLFQTLETIENNFYLTDSVARCNHLFSVVRENLNSVEEDICRLEDIRTRQACTGQQQRQHFANVLTYLREKHEALRCELKLRLEQYSEKLQLRRSRMRLYSSPDLTWVGPPEALQSGSILMEEDRNCRPEPVQCQTIMEVYDEHSERNDLAHIESTVVDIGQMLQTIAVAVERQKESVERIDSNLENAAANVDSAYSELLKSFRTYTSRQSLTVKILTVLIMSFVLSVLVL